MIYAISLLIVAYACDPALTELFTPPRPQLGRYEICTTSAPIETLSGGTALEILEPFDAFGMAGQYDRSRLARLYSSTRVKVARRWQNTTELFTSETLVSPYPDALLTRLLPGTMVIRWTVSRAAFTVAPR